MTVLTPQHKIDVVCRFFAPKIAAKPSYLTAICGSPIHLTDNLFDGLSKLLIILFLLNNNLGTILASDGLKHLVKSSHWANYPKLFLFSILYRRKVFISF